ncbi:Hsp20/alpha crystallin family protein [Lewinella sp. W8]|uniref:Hsp20/alpha crystallin family protein n=1 Tax=Lewinella sp. W8 TaxID=2528208 RepID=UPI001068364E|nr:Hsp20/alpha crystallin family protein [Lewinella sp. W8]MTB50868.1 Hsp20 family protein [Lewinella sp. W8]
MKTFTSFRGITPSSLRTRYVDSIFDDQRRRLFGDHTIDGSYELSIPGANVTTLDEKDNGGYLIEIAAPGYEKSDFDISVFADTLTIQGEIANDRRRSNDSFSRREYNYQSFSRSFTLPESADEENISADYRNGILAITVPTLKPVEETETPRRIMVGS